MGCRLCRDTSWCTNLHVPHENRLIERIQAEDHWIRNLSLAAKGHLKEALLHAWQKTSIVHSIASSKDQTVGREHISKQADRNTTRMCNNGKGKITCARDVKS